MKGAGGENTGRRPVVIHLRRSLDGVSQVLSSYLTHMAKERDWILRSEFYADALPRDQESRFGGSLGRIVRNLIEATHPAGFIVEYAPPRQIPQAAFGDIPVVYVDSCGMKPAKRVGCVRCDDREIACAAAGEMLSLGYTQCAFVRWFTRSVWSVEREREFRRLAKEKGIPFAAIDCPQPERNRIAEIVRQIATMPKPCAVFAVNDFIARYVVDACMKLGLRIPEDVAVLGVDNNESICEHLQSTLSSVSVDLRREAAAACEILERMMGGAAGETRTYGSAGVVRRASTRVVHQFDVLAMRAAEFIRLNHARRIGVAETAAALGCAPATLQRRFTRATGHAVGEEIANVRFESAKRLLTAPGCVVSSVANLCGYDSDSTLRYAFKARLGMSPRAFRDGGSPAFT